MEAQGDKEMTDFVKYMHVERLGTSEVEGITEGLCEIFPKIDGTNASVWCEDGELKAGSRNRELTINSDNAGFYAWVLEQESLKEFFKRNPETRLYGEWLVPHTLKTYHQDAWRRFYVFDVWDGRSFMPYAQYHQWLRLYGIDLVESMGGIDNPTQEELEDLVVHNKFLVTEGVGEGIVIKNYDFVNRYGRTTWAKLLAPSYKEKRVEKSLSVHREIEERIAERYVTQALVDKVYDRISLSEAGWSSKCILQLLGTVYYDLVREETWNFLKHFKRPTVDFKALYKACNARVKTLKSEVFS